MARGKYSPTVTGFYYADPDWHKKLLEQSGDAVYDAEGFDKYGYNAQDVDRAGHTDNDYLMDGDIYDQVQQDWSRRCKP